MPRKSRDIMEKRWIAMPAVLSFLVVAHARVDATAVTYDFTLIAADGGPLTAFNSNIYPAVNGAGAVAFQAWTSAGVEGIFVGSGGNVTTIASNAAGTPFDFFGPGLAAGPLIEGDGDVAFKAYLKAGGQGIFLSEGAVIDIVARTSLSAESLQLIGMNQAGVVAYSVEQGGGSARVFTFDDGVVTTIASGAVSATGAINSAGTVAFVQLLPSSEQLVAGNGGPLTRIAATGGDSPFRSIFSPSINANGTVAFVAYLDGSTGIFTGNGGPITTFVDSLGPYLVFDFPSINSDGVIAFRAVLDGGGVGIFTGPDPTADRVIGSGDPLFGSRVGSLEFGGGYSLNDAGQVVFRAGLYDGRTVLVRADPTAPVPEPPSLLYVGLGLAVCASRKLHAKRIALMLGLAKR
jgi:hypothetical protein